MPKRRLLVNENDGATDSRLLLEQEQRLSAHAARFGVPVPAVRALDLSESLDVLVSECVEADDTTVADGELGALAARIHGIPYDGPELVEQRGGSADTAVVTRIGRRVEALERRTGEPVGLPARDILGERLEREYEARLLHMDLRPANVLVRGHRAVALIDWDNAVMGDPALELARIAEYGHVSDEFRVAYEAVEPLPTVAWAVELIYRLDTALMLAIVFLSEAPDPRAAEPWVRRVAELAGGIRQEV